MSSSLATTASCCVRGRRLTAFIAFIALHVATTYFRRTSCQRSRDWRTSTVAWAAVGWASALGIGQCMEFACAYVCVQAEARAGRGGRVTSPDSMLPECLAGQVVFADVDVYGSEIGEQPSRPGATPALTLWREGEVVGDMHEGLSLDAVAEMLEEHLAGK